MATVFDLINYGARISPKRSKHNTVGPREPWSSTVAFPTKRLGPHRRSSHIDCRCCARRYRYRYVCLPRTFREESMKPLRQEIYLWTDRVL
jgi:hypothetical protein